MSTHRAEVVPVTLEPHPNADALSLVRVFGYTVCARTADWQGVDRAAYLPVDSVVPDAPEYAFLAGHRRIKAKRLRGIYSEGLLVPAPANAQIGDDVTEALGITFYDPDTYRQERGAFIAADTAPEPPGGLAPKYTDIENIKRYGSMLDPGEPVVATEKIHGANFRATYREGALHVGTRGRWLKPDVPGEGSMWWNLALKHALETKLSRHPGVILYGEAFGQVQDLKYGAGPGEVSLAAFDLWREGGYLDYVEFEAICEDLEIPTAPMVYSGPFDLDQLRADAEHDSLIGGGIREGLVVRPIRERRHEHNGRVILKLISERYRLRKGA